MRASVEADGVQLLVTVAAATVVGLIAHRTRLPSGALVGSIVGAAATTIVWGESLVLPPVFLKPAFALIGLLTGLLISRRRLVLLVPYLVPALSSAVLLILSGWAIAGLLGMLGIAPPAAVLATSPGALTALVSAAAAQGDGAAEVAFFHVVRLITIIIAVPLVLRLGPRDALR